MIKYTITSILLISLLLQSCSNDVNLHEHKKMQISGKIGENKIIKTAANAFNKQDYNLANVHLSRISEYFKKNDEIQLFYAISLMETDQIDMANMVLSRIVKGNSQYKDDALWYLGVIAFQNNDKETCKIYLKQISKKSDVIEKVKLLLKQL